MSMLGDDCTVQTAFKQARVDKHPDDVGDTVACSNTDAGGVDGPVFGPPTLLDAFGSLVDVAYDATTYCTRNSPILTQALTTLVNFAFRNPSITSYPAAMVRTYAPRQYTQPTHTPFFQFFLRRCVCHFPCCRRFLRALQLRLSIGPCFLVRTT